MSKINLQKLLVWVIRVGLYFSLILPFIVSKSTLYPYVFGRALFFQILIEVLLVFWIALIWFWPKYRPKFYPTHGRGIKAGGWRFLHGPKHGSGKILLNWSIIIFFIALILSTIFSADPARSFWGTQERMTGVFTLLHFGVFYFLLITVMRARRDWLWFLRALVLAGATVSGYVLYQGWFQSISRPNVWFGNPGITGSFLLFFVFLAPIWWISEYSSRGRAALDKILFSLFTVIAIFTELVVLGAIVVNATRAVWAGWNNYWDIIHTIFVKEEKSILWNCWRRSDIFNS
jgi:hypothetical protein